MDKERVLEIAKACGWAEHISKRDLLPFASALEAALLKGKVLVPVEPTRAMVDAVQGEGWHEQGIYRIYKAMIQAAKGGE